MQQKQSGSRNPDNKENQSSRSSRLERPHVADYAVVFNWLTGHALFEDLMHPIVLLHHRLVIKHGRRGKKSKASNTVEQKRSLMTPDSGSCGAMLSRVGVTYDCFRDKRGRTLQERIQSKD
jgi:hypothetical protein